MADILIVCVCVCVCCVHIIHKIKALPVKFTAHTHTNTLCLHMT